jgi:redox-sensitive bicupin YhaK (pirin superfamily)
MPEIAIDARRTELGGGFTVARVLPFRNRRMVGPFIFLDHAGPLALPPERMREADVRPHPHIGLATVSYLFAGGITHRDSLGVVQPIHPGAVNWMTAGRGIAHSERFDDPAVLSGQPFEMMQSWVALPEADEECTPAFDAYPESDLPQARDGGLWLRLIAGEAHGLKSPVRTRSPLVYLHAELAPGAALTLPTGYTERAVYVARGSLEVDGTPCPAGRMLVFAPGESPRMTAPEAARVMVLGGEPLGPRHIWWNFVSSRKERIEQAKADWREGRIPLPPDDRAEFIPLPEEPRRPPRPEPLS